MKTLMVMAGGTGGHIFPGIAVAETLRARGGRVGWMRNAERMAERLGPAHGHETAWVRFGALRGKGLMRKLSLPFNLLSGCWQAFREIRRVKPDVVLGMGGYITVPGGLMAALTGRPLVVHEQNSIAGLANRMLAKIARRVVCGFPGALSKSVWAGNPVRREIADLTPPAERMAARLETDEPLRLLVLGGSLGAAALNEMVPKGVALLPENERPVIVHQAGAKHLAQLEKNYEDAGVRANCVAFVDDMAGAYEWADLVICRAGALTVAELAAAGIASILVPFPFAVDDHQTSNARFLASAGGAVLLPQNEMTPEAVSLLRNYSRGQLLQMAEKARALAKPDAADEVARVCEEIAQ